MSLNDMQLPTALLVDFYQKNLIKETAGIPVVASHTGPSGALPFLGKNLRNIALLVHYENDVYLPETQLQFLTNILAACRLNLGDVAIVNTAKHAVTPAILNDQLKPGYIIGFGVDAQATGFPEEALFKITHLNGKQLLWAPAAELLNGGGQESKALKSKLWLCLKTMFNV